MGQRLNIEIKMGGKIQANAYYHWSAYTNSSIEIAKQILEHDMNDLNSCSDLIKAIRLLELTGAGLTENEKKYVSESYPGLEFAPCNGRSEGLIAVTENGKKETRTWEEGRVTLDFDKKIVKFNVWFKHTIKDFQDWYDDREIDFILQKSPFYMTFDRFINEFSKQNFEWFCFKYKNHVIMPIH